jgi:hypothetical protein
VQVKLELSILDCLVIQTSIVILTKHAGINPITLRSKPKRFILTSLVANVAGVDVTAIEKLTKRVLKHVLGEQIYN